MNDIAKECAILAARAQENLTKRIVGIENEGAETIRRLVQESENQTAARIVRVQEEYADKTAALEHDFQSARKNLRGKIFHDVLHGET